MATRKLTFTEIMSLEIIIGILAFEFLILEKTRLSPYIDLHYIVILVYWWIVTIGLTKIITRYL